jgi:aarF domain-containing kinase
MLVYISVFVRRGPRGKAELVLLDHGLYEHLKEPDRRNLCQLYKAILERNEAKMENYSNRLGVKGKRLFTQAWGQLKG